MKTWKQILEVSPPLVRLESGKAIYVLVEAQILNNWSVNPVH